MKVVPADLAGLIRVVEQERLKIPHAQRETPVSRRLLLVTTQVSNESRGRNDRLPRFPGIQTD
jgi:hypothetical protein